MENGYRPHLLIPEEEVEYIENNPTARSKEITIDRFEHGTKLSNGLQSIVDAYTRVQTTDSLNDEDIRVFEVVLPEGSKFSDKTLRDFLSGEGLSITSVRDPQHAIVSSTRSGFAKLQERVGSFRDNRGSTKKFLGIDSFGVPIPEEKMSQAIKELIAKVGDSIQDVEIREELLIAQIGEEGQKKAERKLIEKIKQSNGEIIGAPYQLTDKTSVIRAKVPIKSMKHISEDTLVCHVERTGFYGTAPAYSVASQNDLRLDPSVNIESLPIVAVLDTGVDFPPELEPIVFEHWTPDGADAGDCEHGTSVASKVAFEKLGLQMMNPTMFPRCRIIDCNIRGKDPFSDEDGIISNQTIISRIQEAVLRYKDVTKIFNFSSAARVPIEGDTISILGYELDALSMKYGVKFTLAAGNHELYKYEDSLEAILNDDESRIAAPSDSMLNITVGAVAGQSQPGSISKEYEVAPYSRIGPGFMGYRKPDIVALGANQRKNGNPPPDTFAMMIGANGKWIFDAGTSYTAPVVAGDLAQITQTVPGQDILMAETLLYHGAYLPIIEKGKEKITKDDNVLYGNLYGRGISDPIASMYSTMDKVTFVHRGTMNKRQKQRVKYLIPKVCDEYNMKKQNEKIKITVTCVTQAPVDNTKGQDYLGAYVNASLHSINRSGNEETKNPSETDGRKEWDTCFHFVQTFSSFHSGDWEVWLQLYTRYDIADDEEIDYAIAITVEDLTKTMELYDRIIEEAENRFPAVNFVRIPVRNY